MSVALNEAINQLDPESLCYRVYWELYHFFYNSQDKKDEQHPWGIEEGDDTSIRLRNTSYGFAYVIAEAVSQEAGTSGDHGTLLDYVKKTGDTMTGKLHINYGLEAGESNEKLLETFRYDIKDDEGNITGERKGVRLLHELHTGNLYINDIRWLWYEKDNESLHLEYNALNFGNSTLLTSGSLTFGDKENGLFLSADSILYKGNTLYHTANANREDTDWQMKDANVRGNLIVSKETELYGKLKANGGFELGEGQRTLLKASGNGELSILSYLDFEGDFGIRHKGTAVLSFYENKDVQLCAKDGHVLLGSDETSAIRLLTDLTDVDNEYTLITTYGSAWFPDGLKVQHDYGELLLKSYRKNKEDEGIVLAKRLRFGKDTGYYLCGNETGLSLRSDMNHITLSFTPSTSVFAPKDKDSVTLKLQSDADFLLVDKPIENTWYVGIAGSYSRLSDGKLYLSQNNYLYATPEGIKHYGNSYITANIGTESFSPGYAGYGWCIEKRESNQNRATFDELVVRKKIQAYGIELQDYTPLLPHWVSISGSNIFYYPDLFDNEIAEPDTICLVATEHFFEAEQRQWYYADAVSEWVLLDEGENEINLFPDADYWHNRYTLTIKYRGLYKGNWHEDIFTLTKLRDGKASYSIYIRSSNGTVFKNGKLTTTLCARVYKGSEQITELIPAENFRWWRKSDNPDSDLKWNAKEIRGKCIEITEADVYSHTVFDCEVTLSKEGSIIISTEQNVIMELRSRINELIVTDAYEYTGVYYNRNASHIHIVDKNDIYTSLTIDLNTDEVIDLSAFEGKSVIIYVDEIIPEDGIELCVNLTPKNQS